MADSAVVVTAGTGTNIDTRTEATNGHHRQVVVLGDPATNDGVAPVDATAGLKVNLGADNDVTVTGTVDLGATDNAVLDTIAAKDFATQTTLAAMNAKMVTGTDIGDVTINNAAGASAVNIQDGGNTITVDGTVAITNAGITTLAGAVSGTEMQVDVLTMPTVTVTATNLDVQSGGDDLATSTQAGAIQTATELIDDAIYADDADWTDSTSKHALVGGLYQSTPQTVTDGDVAPFNITANGALHVAVQNGVTVDLGANNDVTVTSGTITAELSAVDNAVLDTIDAVLDTIKTDTASIVTSVGTLDNAISGSEMQVDIVGALPAGTNAIGKLAANSGVDIGDVTLTAGTAAIGTLLPSDIDVTTHTNYARKYYTSTGAVTDGIVWSPAAGKRWHVVALYFQVSAAATVTFEDDKAGGDDPVLKGEYAANGGAFLTFPDKYPMASGEDAADLTVTTSAGNIYVMAIGYEV